MPKTKTTPLKKRWNAAPEDENTPANKPGGGKRTPNTNGPPVRVVGAKLASAKHSGLLAQDTANRRGAVCTDSVPHVAVSLDEAEVSGVFHQATGRDIYGFTRPRGKRSKLSVQQPAVSNGSLEHPESGQSTGEEEEEEKDISEDEEEEEETEQGSRKSLRPRRASVSYVDSSESEVESIDNESDEEEKEEQEEEAEEPKATSSKGKRSEKKSPRRRWRGEADSTYTNEEMVEEYFSSHHGRTGPTSDHTLGKLDSSRLDQLTVQQVLKSAPSRFQADRQALFQHHQSLFQYWLLQLSSGFNILLYGVGSKRNLVEKFRNQVLSSSCHLVINGFFPGTTLKHILSVLTFDLLKHTGSFKSLVDQCQFICSSLCERKDVPSELFLLIHNIDGPNLRGDKPQTSLSLLAKCPHIHIVATVDHINAPLIWDQVKSSRFNWVWHDCTTFEPYRIETSYENSLLVKHSGSLALSSLTHVTQSLTPNARGIFKLLTRHQLDHKDETSYAGLPFSELYRLCRENFLVNSDVTLRAQLTEFRDHKLVRSRKGSDGTEYLYIPVDNTSLTQFIERDSDENA